MDKLINDFSVGLFFWQSLVFILLIVLLRKFAWKPILDAVNEREESIEGALKAAEQAREEMKSLQANNEAVLKEARDMKNKMIAEAKDAAAAEADKTIASAKAAIEAEKTAAIAALKNHAAALSIDVAEKILGQELSAENKQTAMIGKIIEDVKFN